jgi:hypothetical protein
MFRFGVFGGMCDVNSCNVFLLFFMALWVLISATLFRKAVLVLWHAFLFLGLRFFPQMHLIRPLLFQFTDENVLLFYILTMKL